MWFRVERTLNTVGASIKSSLAGRAIEGRPSRLDDPAYRAGATERSAGVAFAVVNREIVLKITKFAVGLPEILQR